MKKQIGLIALSTLLIACVAFSGVASAQASNVQVLFFYSPLCSICEQVKPLVESAAAQTGVKLIEYNVADSSGGAGIAQANGITGTPTIVIQGGQTLVGAVTEQQIITAIQAATGNQVAKAAATPTVVKATPVPVKATPVPVKATPVPVKATPVPVKAIKTVAKATTQPSIQVVTATQTPVTSTQTVPEFSLLGLGAPALVVGAIYLFLRRR
jgi:cell division septation protein DedD